jgi:hypothetical protein
MTTQNIFPAQALSESGGEPAITMEGKKVIFDKKVSLLPVDIRKEAPVKNTPINPVKIKPTNGRLLR